MAQKHKDFEIIILDQSDTGSSEQAVREAVGCPTNLRYIRSSTVGKSQALNLVMQEARGDIFALTDDDVEAPSDWLDKIEKAFIDMPKADVIFGQVFPCDVSHLKHQVYVPAFWFAERRFLQKGDSSGMGANMAIRREMALKVGCYDPLMGPGTTMPAAEEGDFIYRAQRLGAKVLHEPSISLVHRAWRDKDQWTEVLRSYGMGDAAFAAKHMRCGDISPMMRMGSRYLYFFFRLCYRIITRNKHQEEYYLRGFAKGITRGLRQPLDRSRRVFKEG